MKLFLTELSVPAILLCGIAIATGAAEAIRLRTPAPRKLPAIRATPPPFRVDTLIQVIARKHGLNLKFFRSIIAVESSFRPDALSPEGAVGLMQLMPETARKYGVNPRVVEQNLEGGAMYLKHLLHRYRNSPDSLQCAIAAYNAGPDTVDRYNGIPPIPGTQNFVKSVMARYRGFAPGASGAD